MRVIKGKSSRLVDAADIAAWAARYAGVTIDLGAGDGRYVRGLAVRYPERGGIALDLCEANMGAASREAPGNALFVVGDALALPGELHGIADRVAVNFPWGSLLRGLVRGEAKLLAGLAAVVNGEATLDVVLNGGALNDVGVSMEMGAERVVASLREIGARKDAMSVIGPAELRGFPTSWAKRLAFGRDPRAVRIVATLGSGDPSGCPDVSRAAARCFKPPRRRDPGPTSREAGRRLPARGAGFLGEG